MIDRKVYQGNTENIILTTPQGRLLGTMSHGSSGRIQVFRGIPYAVPPVGNRRWKPAEPAPKWEGVRQAIQYAPHCIQPSTPKDGFFSHPLPHMSEDCLYLNVWAPESHEGPLPVMVWIHGGNLVAGGSSEPLYNGEQLAKKNVIVVSIQYRLNIFGYFSHPELTEESPKNASGNYGTTDQIEALKWVQENITAFGGDPNNVTIFGESAGGLSVSHLLASPLSKGLFHRAIAQSPYLIPMPALQERCYGKKSAEEMGCDVALSADSKTLAELRNLTADALLRAAEEANFVTETVVDNWVFTAQIFEQFEQGKQHDVPILVGNTSGEAYALESHGVTAPMPEDARHYIADVNSKYGALAEEYLSVYPADNLREAVFAPVTDGFYGWAVERFARMTANISASAYLYCFDHPPQWAEDAGLGAFHTAEIPHVFNNIECNVKYSPSWPDYLPSKGEIALAELISDYWVAFATHGIPNVPGKPEWKPYTDESPYIMGFRDGSAHLEINPKPSVYALHEKIVTSRRERGDLGWDIMSIGLSAPVLAVDVIQQHTEASHLLSNASIKKRISS